MELIYHLCELSGNTIGGGKVAEKMLDGIAGKIKSAGGDGAYDGSGFRKKVYEKSGVCIVPPPKDATCKGTSGGWERERDASLAEIEGFGGGEVGRKLWKICSGYHERSLVETAMFRVKKIFAGLKARSMGAQETEPICKCIIINRMNKLGTPKGKWMLKEV